LRYKWPLTLTPPNADEFNVVMTFGVLAKSKTGRKPLLNLLKGLSPITWTGASSSQGSVATACTPYSTFRPDGHRRQAGFQRRLNGIGQTCVSAILGITWDFNKNVAGEARVSVVGNIVT